MELVLKYGQMEKNMKENAEMESLMEEARLLIQMEIFIWASMQMVNVMGMELTSIRMANVMKESGKITYKTVKVQKKCQMDPNLKVHLKMDKRMVMGNINGQMAPNIKEIG